MLNTSEMINKPEKVSTCTFIKQNRWIGVSLFAMNIQWITVSFCFYLIGLQVKYICGQIYINDMSQAASEVVSYAVSSVLFNRIGMKPTFVLGYLISITGMVCLLFYTGANQMALSSFIMSAKFGIACNFNNVYVST